MLNEQHIVASLIPHELDALKLKAIGRRIRKICSVQKARETK
jgi:hypothetical protein